MHTYDELAAWWPVVAPPEHKAEEAALILDVLRAAAGSVHAVVELGSGVGPLALAWPDDLDVVLVDRSEAMLAVSRGLNPGRSHVCADLRTVRLGRTFDAVVLHDVVMYLTAPGDLEAALATAHAHLRPGGVVLVLPDVVRETFEEQTVGGGDTRGGRSARLLEWRWDPDPTDASFRVELAWVLREADGTTRGVHESHEMALFDRPTLWGALRGAGFTPVEVDPLDAIELGEPFVGRA